MNIKADGQAAENDETIVLDDEIDAGAGEGANDDEAKNLDDAGTNTDGEGEGEGQGDGDDDDVVVTIGEEAPPPEDDQKNAPEWVRELRKNYRELQREKRELEDRLKATSGAETKPATTLPKKPTLEACDYDAEKYEAELATWYEQKRAFDEQEAQAQAQAKAEQEAWQAKLQAYGKAKTELKVRDFDEAEHVAQEALNATQQGIILQGSENPALVIYALGKNPKKAKELASITDPVKYAFAVAKLETQLKVTQRKAPPPEKTLSHGTGRISGAVDSTLERLREEAARTGDFTKVHQYRSAQRKKT